MIFKSILLSIFVKQVLVELIGILQVYYYVVTIEKLIISMWL